MIAYLTSFDQMFVPNRQCDKQRHVLHLLGRRTRLWLGRAKSQTYLRFFESGFDDEDRELIGSWVLTTSNQRVQYDLMDDHQLLVYRRPVPFPHPSKHQREWYSKGRWNRQYGRLHLLGTALRFPRSNRYHSQSAPVPQLSHLPIIQFTDDAITLDKNVVLKRAAKPIAIPLTETEE